MINGPPLRRFHTTKSLGILTRMILGAPNPVIQAQVAFIVDSTRLNLQANTDKITTFALVLWGVTVFVDLWLIHESFSWLIQASISRLNQPNSYLNYGWFNYEDGKALPPIASSFKISSLWHETMYQMNALDRNNREYHCSTTQFDVTGSMHFL